MISFVPLTIGMKTAVLVLTQGKYATLDVGDWHLTVDHKWQARNQDSNVWYARGTWRDELGRWRCKCLHQRRAGGHEAGVAYTLADAMLKARTK